MTVDETEARPADDVGGRALTERAERRPASTADRARARGDPDGRRRADERRHAGDRGRRAGQRCGRRSSAGRRLRRRRPAASAAASSCARSAAAGASTCAPSTTTSSPTSCCTQNPTQAVAGGARDARRDRVQAADQPRRDRVHPRGERGLGRAHPARPRARSPRSFTDSETGAIHYGTTDLLLAQLGINSIDELPHDLAAARRTAQTGSTAMSAMTIAGSDGRGRAPAEGAWPPRASPRRRVSEDLIVAGRVTRERRGRRPSSGRASTR